MDQLLNIDMVLSHWPFSSVAVMLAVAGLVADRVFTWERAHAKPGKDFWWWMRETLPLHPVVIGLLLGCVMPDPEGQHWGRGLIVAYFGGAGAAGLGGWVYLRARAKAIPLPGGSVPPTST